MAANTFTLTRRFGLFSNGTDAIIPGDNRRRTLTFAAEDISSSTSIDIVPIGGADTPLFWPFVHSNIFVLEYKQYGNMICEPWYIHTGGLPLTFVVIETLQLP